MARRSIIHGLTPIRGSALARLRTDSAGAQVRLVAGLPRTAAASLSRRAERSRDGVEKKIIKLNFVGGEKLTTRRNFSLTKLPNLNLTNKVSELLVQIELNLLLLSQILDFLNCLNVSESFFRSRN